MTPEQLLFELYQFVFWALRALGFVGGILLFQVCQTAFTRNNLVGFLVLLTAAGTARAQTAVPLNEVCTDFETGSLSSSFTTVGITLYSTYGGPTVTQNGGGGLATVGSA